MQGILQNAKKGETYRTITGRKMKVVMTGAATVTLSDENGKETVYDKKGNPKEAGEGFTPMKLYEKINL